MGLWWPSARICMLRFLHARRAMVLTALSRQVRLHCRTCMHASCAHASLATRADLPFRVRAPRADHMWWASHPGRAAHPNYDAPRCLPCHFNDTGAPLSVQAPFEPDSRRIAPAMRTQPQITTNLLIHMLMHTRTIRVRRLRQVQRAIRGAARLPLHAAAAVRDGQPRHLQPVLRHSARADRDLLDARRRGRAGQRGPAQGHPL